MSQHLELSRESSLQYLSFGLLQTRPAKRRRHSSGPFSQDFTEASSWAVGCASFLSSLVCQLS